MKNQDSHLSEAPQNPVGLPSHWCKGRHDHVWTSRIERVKHLTFQLQSGTIVQRDGRTLVLHLADREMVVGRHRWWYAPAWQAADDVEIVCGRSRQFRRIILENCRLIAEKAAPNATKGLTYPSVKDPRRTNVQNSR